MSSNAGKKVICVCTACKGRWVSKYIHQKHINLKYTKSRFCEPLSVTNTTAGQGTEGDKVVSEHNDQELALAAAQSCNVMVESPDGLQLEVADTCNGDVDTYQSADEEVII